MKTFFAVNIKLFNDPLISKRFSTSACTAFVIQWSRKYLCSQYFCFPWEQCVGKNKMKAKNAPKKTERKRLSGWCNISSISHHLDKVLWEAQTFFDKNRKYDDTQEAKSTVDELFIRNTVDWTSFRPHSVYGSWIKGQCTCTYCNSNYQRNDIMDYICSL